MSSAMKGFRAPCRRDRRIVRIEDFEPYVGSETVARILLPRLVERDLDLFASFESAFGLTGAFA